MTMSMRNFENIDELASVRDRGVPSLRWDLPFGV